MLPDKAFTDLARQAAADGIQQLVVGGIVHRDGAVLLLKRPDNDFMGGIWELPSGKAEPGETLDAAVTREVVEETGLTMTGIDVAATEPVKLTEHDVYAWTPVTDELPVTDAVKTVLLEYRRRTAGL